MATHPCLTHRLPAILTVAWLAFLSQYRSIAQEFRASLPDAATFTSRTVIYGRSGTKDLKADLFLPKKSSKAPVAVFLNGIGADWIRTNVQYQSWGKLATAAGFAGVAMDSIPGEVEDNFDTLAQYLREHADQLKVDADTMIVWSCSSNVQAGLPLVMDARRKYIKSAVVYYGAALLTDTRMDLPILVVRAGLDSASLNQRIQEVVSFLVLSNTPVTVINYAGGHHGFDLFDDSPMTRKAVADTLQFMKESVSASIQKTVVESAPEAEAAGLAARGEWSRAVAAYARLAELHPQSSDLQRMLGDSLAASGEHKQALSSYQRAIDLGDRNTGMIAYAAALSAMKIGDREAAFRWLERLAPIPPMRQRAKGDPAFAELRGDPRFVQLLGE